MERQNNHKDRAHALLSPSKAKRWINCPPSALLESGEKDYQSSAALEGTTAHEVSELFVRHMLGHISAVELKNELNKKRKIAHKLMYSDEMVEHAQKYWSEIDGLMRDFLGVDEPAAYDSVKVEAKAPLGKVTGEKGQSGSVDFKAWTPRKLLVIDYKYGRGVRVDAQGNEQMRTYALSHILENPGTCEDVMLVIYQPRLDHISTETISVKELLSWHEKTLKPAATLALKGAGEHRAGSWCKFCKVEGKCKALAREALDISKKEFDDVKIMTPAEQKEIFDMIPRVTSFLKALGEDMLKQALIGVNYPGLKVVEANTRRKWEDPETVQALLEINGYDEDSITKKSLKPIGEIEKLIGKKTFNNEFYMLTEKPPGGPALAAIDDKRPAFNDVQKDFEEFDDNINLFE